MIANEKKSRTAMASMLITLKAIAKIQGNKNLEALVRVSGPYFLKAEKKQMEYAFENGQEWEFSQGILDEKIEARECFENFNEFFNENFTTH